MRFLHPDGWPAAKGYANGVLAEGRLIFVAGQVGCDAGGTFAADLPSQVEQALKNIVAVLESGGARPDQVVRLTWYMTDLGDYNARLGEIGAAYRRIMGRHFPAMTAIEVRALVDPRARVEIEATAVIE